jgi:hypothetical protein
MSALLAPQPALLWLYCCTAGGDAAGPGFSRHIAPRDELLSARMLYSCHQTDVISQTLVKRNTVKYRSATWPGVHDQWWLR